MASFTTSEPAELLELLMTRGGYATRTRARKAIKAGEVQVNGQVLKIPSAEVPAGAKVSWSRSTDRSNVKDFDLGKPTPKRKSIRPPFEIVHEDANFLAYVKPAGWVFASPNPKVKTSYTAMRQWMERERPEATDVHFVNRIEKESSGICLIAKSLAWRKHLQDNWSGVRKGLYVLMQGHLPADDVLTTYVHEDGKRTGPMREWPYRTMRATEAHTLIKLEGTMDDVPLLMSALRRHGCMLLGKGKEAPDPLSRSGLHLYAMEFDGPDGNRYGMKTRVPREFLGLVKGGQSPKPVPRSQAQPVQGKKPHKA